MSHADELFARATMAVIAYRLQPWAFVDRLLFELAPSGFDIVPMARDASAEERAVILANAEYLMGSWVTTAVKLAEDDFRAAPRLKLLQLMSAGYEHVDLDLAARYRVPVATFGDAMASVVAEHTLLLILTVYRRLLQLDAAVRAGTWRKDEPELRELRGKRVGLIGFGYIGHEVAVRLRAFQAEVVYFARRRRTAAEEGALGLQFLPLDELLRTSDVVSVHVALAPSTRGLIGARELELMQPSAVLINTSRGPVVDQPALFDALYTERLSGAGLDVLDPEPPDLTEPLLRLPNVVFTPHTGGQADQVWPRIVRACFDNIERVARGEPPRFIATAPHTA
ncbi:MAG: lactate dehydrogenase [Chloroflexi bacterium]|nr:lactate dehydrogenase [Chloroflexota bacterium]